MSGESKSQNPCIPCAVATLSCISMYINLNSIGKRNHHTQCWCILSRLVWPKWWPMPPQRPITQNDKRTSARTSLVKGPWQGKLILWYVVPCHKSTIPREGRHETHCRKYAKKLCWPLRFITLLHVHIYFTVKTTGSSTEQSSVY